MPFGELIEKIPILPINKGFQHAKKKLDSIVYSMIKEHRDKESKGIPQSRTYYILYCKLKMQKLELDE